MRQLVMVMGMALAVAAPAAAQLEPLDPALDLVCEVLDCDEFCPAFPATGQTTSHYPGDDGDVEAGGTLSYTDNGDGTVTDNNTGLMWEKKTALDGVVSATDLHDADNRYPWIGSCLGVGGQCGSGSDCVTPVCQATDAQATGHTIFEWVAALNAANFAGHSDWRVPNLKELGSIVDYGKSIDYEDFRPMIDAAFGPTQGEVGAAYWSSTVVQEVNSGGAPNAWGFEFLVGAPFRIEWAANKNVRAVRGGS